jgi:3-hydroxyacyl-[acyl-carrier-protein] dehydratase
MMMNIDEVKVLLHHREPYLMVDRIDALTCHAVTGVKSHRGDEAHLAGHFPGAPVVPGAMLQELCTQSAGALITKFYSPVENYDSEKTKGHALGVLAKVAYAMCLQKLSLSNSLGRYSSSRRRCCKTAD